MLCANFLLTCCIHTLGAAATKLQSTCALSKAQWPYIPPNVQIPWPRHPCRKGTRARAPRYRSPSWTSSLQRFAPAYSPRWCRCPALLGALLPGSLVCPVPRQQWPQLIFNYFFGSSASTDNVYRAIRNGTQTYFLYHQRAGRTSMVWVFPELVTP
jgi:hypothetical protein